MDPRLGAFFALSALLTVTPGADMALVTRNTLLGGRGAAVFTTVGICLGVAVHAILWAVGLSALISRSAGLYEAVKLAGAGYIIYLGLRSMVFAGREGAAPHSPFAIGSSKGQGRAGASPRFFAQGLLTNVLNPKVALFYLTFLPQFVGPGDPVIARSLMLAGIHISLSLVWLLAYSHLIARLSSFLTRIEMRRRLERITGMLLVALGLRLLWERR